MKIESNQRGERLSTTRDSSWAWVVPTPPVPWHPYLPKWCVEGVCPEHMRPLNDRLRKAHAQGVLCPPLGDVWRGFALTSPDNVRVLVMGQDPYHGPGQAHGLAFSIATQEGRMPPSLRNVFQELHTDLNRPLRTQRSLEDWATQGILLVNATLTTELGQAGAHHRLGWETLLEDALTQWMKAREEPVVWLLWGRHAQALHNRLSKRVMRPQDAVIASAHPSPLSASRGFLGSRPFSAVNKALTGLGKEAIDWG